MPQQQLPMDLPLLQWETVRGMQVCQALFLLWNLLVVVCTLKAAQGLRTQLAIRVLLGHEMTDVALQP